MPSAQPTSYSAAAGLPIIGGLDVLSDVWYPTKDGSGNIKDTSWNNLPLDRFVRTNGTSFQQIKDILLAGGYDITSTSMNYGNSRNVAATFRTWSSPAINYAAGDVYNGPSGGHDDSTYNGINGLRLEKMGGGAGWFVEKMPTIFPGNELIPSTAGYQANALNNFMAWQPAVTAPPEEVAFSWTDFIPRASDQLFFDSTARHQYGGFYYDSIRNHLVSTRASITRYDLNTHAYVGRQRPIISGVENPIDLNGYGYGQFCADNDTFVGNLPRTRTSPSPANDLGYYSGTSPVRNSLDSTVGSPVVADQCQAWTRVDANNIIAIGNNGAGIVYGELNIKTRTRPQAAAPISGGMASSGDHPAACYVPARTGGRWNKIIRRLNNGTGTWRIIDWATKTETAFTPTGAVPPFAAQPGGWMFLYTRHDGQAFVIYISAVDDTSDAVYVMRVGL